MFTLMGDLRRNNKLIDLGANNAEDNPLIENLDKHPDPPKRLTKTQKNQWVELVQSLPPDWFITADLVLLETYVISLCDYREFMKKARRGGSIVYVDKNGVERMSKWWDMAEKTKQYIMTTSGKLKLHPRSREGGTLSKSRTAAKTASKVADTGRRADLLYVAGGKKE